MRENAGSKKPPTLFPKITSKVDEIIEAYKYKLRRENGFKAPQTEHTVLKLIGTVKLHGSHADIMIHADDTIQLQSRNRVGLTCEADNHDFAKVFLPLRAEALDLKRRYRERFLELRPSTKINEEHPTIIAGEYIGPGVQKKVAIDNLPSRLFIIVSVSINNAWLPDEPYADIHNEAAGIYNISRGGFYHEELAFDNVKASRQRLQDLTVEVERECPFAKSLGIVGGGEGIVWKVSHPYGADARFWLKTKGAQWAATTEKQLAVGSMGSETEEAKELAEAAVSENRLAQGWEYLGEMGMERSMGSVMPFMKWVGDDVEVEERGKIARREINVGLLRKYMGIKSKAWYVKKLAESAER